MNKFNVGEEVVLVSETYPEYTGEYVVEEVITGQEYLLLSPWLFKPNSPYYYKLKDLNIELVFTDNNPTEITMNYAREAFLRKKHKTSEFGSFTNLMNNLKLPQNTPQEVN